MTGPVHVPVMRDRVVALLAPALAEPGAVFVDALLRACALLWVVPVHQLD